MIPPTRHTSGRIARPRAGYLTVPRVEFRDLTGERHSVLTALDDNP